MAKKFLTGITIATAVGGEYTFPIADGSANQAIITDGNGNLSFGSAIASSAEDAQRLVCEMINASGSTIGSFIPVCCVGIHSDGTPEIAPARSDNPLYMPAIGITQSSVGNNNRTDVLLYGKLEGINTTPYATGDTLYVAPTGGWTTTRPTGDNLIQGVFKVGRIQQNNGSGGAFGAGKYEDLPNIGEGKIWIGNSSSHPVATSLSTAIPTALGYTPANDANVVHLTGNETINGIKTFTNSVRIDGGTTGQFLGIKQYVSGTSTGLSGFTSIYASGTDTLGISFGAANDILFKTASPTFPRTYTFPDATGTVALTSDIPSLTNYVTTNTLQTITGIKTFSNEALFGNNITLTGGDLVIASGSYNSNLNSVTLSANRNINFPDASGVVALTSNLNSYVPTSRTITINDTTYDLSEDRSWTISANLNAREETEFTTDGTTNTYNVTYTVGQVDVFYNGSKLASTEFTATNGTSVTLGFTPPSGQIVEVVAWETGGGIGGTGTTNYIPKWTGSGSIGNSIIYDNGTTVSIGTTTSTLKFNVNGDVYASGGFFASNSLSFIGSLNNISGISVNGTTGNTSFRAGGSDVLTATNDGNVGINQTSPSYKLDVNGTGRFTGDLIANGVTIGASDVRSSSNVLTLGGTSEIMRLNSTGVGIKTTSPEVDFQVGANSGTPRTMSLRYSSVPLYMSNTWTGTYSKAVLSINYWDTSNGSSSISSFSNVNYAAGSIELRSATSGSDILFNTITSVNTEPTERMRIDASGNVGIGSPSVGSKLYTYLGADGTHYRGRTIDGSNNPYIDIKTSGGTVYLDANGSAYGQMAFKTGDIERMRITSGGEILINTSTGVGSSARLSIVNSTAQEGLAIKLANTSAYSPIAVRNSSNGYMFQVNQNAYCAVNGGTTTNYFLEVYGSGVYGAGAYVNGSDIRLKENIIPIDKGLDFVTKMKPVSFNYIESYSKDKNIQVGFIAQDLQKIFKNEIYLDGIVIDKMEHLNVAYQSLIPILVKSIQELKAEIDELKARLN